MSQIVVGVDESEGAALALQWAVREGELRGWSVEAVMAWGFLDQHQGIVGERFDPQYGEGDAVDALREIVVSAVGEERAASIEHRTVCDLPAQALLDASRDSELLVVGARGLGGFRGLLLGSVSQHCLHHASSPIAVVRGSRSRENGEDERVVVAVDGSDTAVRALRWAFEEAHARGAVLRVVNAWHQPYVGGYPYTTATFDPSLFENASRQVVEEAIAAAHTNHVDVPIERVSAQGSSAGVVLDAAADADLVVMGSRGLGGFKGMLLGSVTNQVTQHAPCPVVVVPPQS